jgi:hypothetical protein
MKAMAETGALLVRQARAFSGLSQRALALRAGDHQPNVAAIESGGRDAYVATIARLVHAAGGRLCVLPTTAATVADVAADIAALLGQGATEVAYRTVIGLHDELLRTPAALRVALCVTPPPPVGDVRFDALLASVVEHDLRRDRLPLPEWVDDPRRHAGGWWVEDLPEMRDVIRKATPPAFRRHGVWLNAAELESV